MKAKKIMCLILQKPAGKKIDPKTLETIYDNNPDGFGAMRATTSGKLHIMRTMKGWRTIQELVEAYEGYDAVFHWRWATHGHTTLDMTHPFMLTENIALMHNGVIDIDTEHKDESDTAAFCREVLKPLAESHPESLFDGTLNAAIEMAIGSGSKLLIMDSQGRTQIYNEQAGTWKEGCWLSNTYSLDPAHRDWNYGNSTTFGRQNLVPYKAPTPAIDPPSRAPEESDLEVEPESDVDLPDSEYFSDFPACIGDLRGVEDFDIEQLCYTDPDLVAELLIKAARSA